jgi:hypothetical protein
MIDDLRFAIRMLGRERWLTAVTVISRGQITSMVLTSGTPPSLHAEEQVAEPSAKRLRTLA